MWRDIVWCRVTWRWHGVVADHNKHYVTWYDMTAWRHSSMYVNRSHAVTLQGKKIERIFVLPCAGIESRWIRSGRRIRRTERLTGRCPGLQMDISEAEWSHFNHTDFRHKQCSVLQTYGFKYELTIVLCYGNISQCTIDGHIQAQAHTDFNFPISSSLLNWSYSKLQLQLSPDSKFNPTSTSTWIYHSSTVGGRHADRNGRTDNLRPLCLGSNRLLQPWNPAHGESGQASRG